MHVDRDQHRLQPALQPLGQSDVAVLDGGHGENRKAVGQHDNRRNIQHEHSEPIDGRGHNVLDRMVAHRGRHVDIGIRMMQRVKAPEERHRVLAPMHGVAHQVEQQKT